MTDLTGELFGNYKLVRQIGHGGFANVYLGDHVYLQTQAAIKILQVQLSEDALENFLREARTVTQLEHPHIVRILECGVEKNVPFLVMNYAPGGSIRQRYRSGSRVPLEQVSLYISQAASALQYAHERKLIHRDIKPENMLLGRNDTLLLSDFGLVLLAQSTNAQTLKEVAGTVPYMAPEQLQGRPQIASDQYALGVVAYEWLSGTQPFRGSFVEVASQHVLSAPPPLYERIPGISREIEQVVLTALAKNPLERFASVEAFASALALAISPASGTVLPTMAAFPPTSPFPQSVAPTLIPTALSASSYVASPPSSALSSQRDIFFTPALNQSLQLAHIDERPTLPVSAVSQSDVRTYIKSEHTSQISSNSETFVRANANAPIIQQSGIEPVSGDLTSIIRREPFSLSQSTKLNPAPRATKRRKPLVIAASLLALVLILLLVLIPLLLPRVQQVLGFSTHQLSATITAPAKSTGVASGTNTTNATVIPTPTQQLANHLTPTATSTTTSNKLVLSVLGASASVSPGSYHGSCTTPVPLTFTGTIQVSPGSSGGSVSYTWLRSNNSTGSTETVTFKPGDTVRTVTSTWQGPTSPGTTTLWEALEVISPNAITSQHASIQFVCDSAPPAFTVTSITVSQGDVSVDGCSNYNFNMLATISLSSSSGGKVTYTWVRSDGTTDGPHTVTVAAGQNQVVVSDTWTTPISSSEYWVEMNATSPNNISSNQDAFFGIFC